MKFQVDDIRALRAALESMCSALEAQSVPENAVFDCKVVACELLSNALRYGGGAAMFGAEKRENEVVIRVRSANAFRRGFHAQGYREYGSHDAAEDSVGGLGAADRHGADGERRSPRRRQFDVCLCE